MDQAQLEFLEQLSNGFGPPGFEQEVLRTVRDYVTPHAGSLEQDRLGSLLFSRRGGSERPVILLPGHVDEIGFIISGVNDKGFLTFLPLGGWFDQVLLGQRVVVRTRAGDREGVIAAKPPHLLPQEERTKVVNKDAMFIDIGCASRREAEALGVRVGDPAVPRSAFSTFEKLVFPEKTDAGAGSGGDQAGEPMQLAMGKAFDDRVGTFVAAEVVRRLAADRIDHPNTVIGAATVQEEVGARGAGAAAWLADPDVVIALEADISGDVPGIEPHKAPAVMGKGPAVLAYDASMIPNSRLKQLVVEAAEAEKIPHQISILGAGGTDAGPIHRLRHGCPGLVIGVPTRHIHSHAGILSLSDIEHTVNLLLAVIRRLDAAEVAKLTGL